jgi:hypothetical protein
MRTSNKAYFAKLAWNLVTTIDKLWVQVKRETYDCGSFLTPQISIRSNCFKIWKAITNLWPDIERNVSWIRNNRLETRLWKDSWVPGCANLEDICDRQIPQQSADFPALVC